MSQQLSLLADNHKQVNVDATVSIGPSLCSVTDDTTSYQTKVDIIILYFYKKGRSKWVF